jgi:hypothetical protein
MVSGPGYLPGAPFCLVRIKRVYLSKLKIMNIITITELTDEEYVFVNKLANDKLVNDFIKVTECLEVDLMNNNIDANQIYRYLVTLMINQC